MVRINPEVVIPAVLAIGFGYVLVPAIVFEWLGATKSRSVACPADDYPATVRIGGLSAVKRAFIDTPLCVSKCSRWPERVDCNRACARQITYRAA